MKKKIIWIGIIILAAVSIIGLKMKMGSQGIIVETAKVSRGDIEEYVEETGILLLEEETAIYSASAGKIKKVEKEAGQTVKKGEIIAKIDNNDLLLQIEALEAQKLAASAKYDEARSSADDEKIQSLEAQVRYAEAAHEDAKRSADTYRTLYEAGATSLEAYKDSVTKLASAEAALYSARSNLAEARKGISAYVKKQYEAQLSEIQTRIDQLRLKAEEAVIKSPIDGMVMAVAVKEGSIVQAGAKLFDIGGTKGYYIECDVLIEDIRGIKPGSAVIIEDEDLGLSKMMGTVRKIHPAAFSKMSELGIEQKRVKVEIDITGGAEGLRPGYDMTVKITARSSKDTLLLNEKALFTYQGKDHVFVNENGTAKLRAIETGLQYDGLVEILKGLNEGEEVILSPDEKLEEGMRIKPEYL